MASSNKSHPSGIYNIPRADIKSKLLLLPNRDVPENLLDDTNVLGLDMRFLQQSLMKIKSYNLNNFCTYTMFLI